MNCVGGLFPCGLSWLFSSEKGKFAPVVGLFFGGFHPSLFIFLGHTAIQENKKSFFRYVGSQRESKGNFGSLLNQLGQLTTDAQEKANLLNGYVVSVFHQPHGMVLPTVGQGGPGEGDSLPSIEADLMKEHLNKLDTFKSVGPDGLHPRVLRKLASIIAQEGCSQIFKGNSRNRRGRERFYKRPCDLTLPFLNIDYRLIAKTLALRMRKNLQKIMYEEQVYTVPGRRISKAIKVIRYTVPHPRANLDLEKAYDRVDHDYIFKVLEKMGFPEECICWIRLLYREAESQVQINGYLSRAFKIHKWVRQGCFLSLLLFACNMEYLAQRVKKDKVIRRVETLGGGEVKCILYMDDINVILLNVGTALSVLATSALRSFCSTFQQDGHQGQVQLLPHTPIAYGPKKILRYILKDKSNPVFSILYLL
uniref:Reverse transcriptase domain-containing protein n=1 Tax=Crocodylus porosus TaxID=8502 RepID=A0A7M4E7A5_CROPO